MLSYCPHVSWELKWFLEKILHDTFGFLRSWKLSNSYSEFYSTGSDKAALLLCVVKEMMVVRLGKQWDYDVTGTYVLGDRGGGARPQATYIFDVIQPTTLLIYVLVDEGWRGISLRWRCRANMYWLTYLNNSQIFRALQETGNLVWTFSNWHS